MIDPEHLLEHAGTQAGEPPLERWNPPLAGEMDLRIARDGSWWHEDSRIEREALVRLFARILRREADGHHYLVTPVEKWRIGVDDAPFVAGLLEREGEGADQRLRLATNLGETVELGPEHALELEHDARGEPRPYVRLRHGLRARVDRAAFVELAGLALEHGGRTGVWSRGVFFALDEPGPA